MVGYCRDHPSQESALREVVREIEQCPIHTPQVRRDEEIEAIVHKMTQMLQTRMNLVLAMIGRVKASILLDEMRGMSTAKDMAAHLKAIERFAT